MITSGGGAGNDTLTGGTGDDIFAWRLGDQGTTAAPAADTVTDFSMAQGDVLDLRDLLQGEENASDLGQYLTFTQSGTNTVIGVSHDGSGHVTQKLP